MLFFQIFLTGTVLGVQVAMLATALHTVFSVSKSFHLALAALSTALAYAAWWGISHSFSVLATIAFFLAVGFALAVFSFWLFSPVIQRKQALLATLLSFALGLAIEAILAISFGADGKTIPSTQTVFQFWGLSLPFSSALILGLGAIATAFFLSISHFLPMGRTLAATAESVPLAESLGIPTKKVRFFVFLFATLLAGAIGFLRAADTMLTPFSGFSLLLSAFVALLVGGAEAPLFGTIVAAFLLAIFPELVIAFSPVSLSSSAKPVILFLIASVLLVWRPRGLFVSMRRSV